MSWKRVFSSAIGISVAALGVLTEWGLILVVLTLTIGGLYEFFYMIKKKGIPIYSYTGIAIGVLIPLTTFFRFEPTKGWELLFIALVLVMVFIMQFMRKDNNNAIIGISTTLFGVLYVSWLFSFLIKIRYLLPGVEGMKLLAFILIVTKIGDMGALIVGSQIGKKPLFPRISPSKTIEGSVGSFLFSMVAAVLCRSFLPVQIQEPFWQPLLIGFFFGGMGQLGDMSESLIKRDCQIKDSGKIFPAMGGVLDTIDSLLFCAPVFYFYISRVLTG